MSHFFQTHTYKGDYEMCLSCVKTVRRYNEEFIQVVSDGEFMSNAQIDTLHAFGNLEVIHSKRLMLFKDSGTRAIQRKLEFISDLPYETVISLDTDARCWRKPFYVPDAELFGTLNTRDRQDVNDTVWTPQGGCWGLSKKLVRKVLNGKFFETDEWMSVSKRNPVLNRAGVLADDYYIGKIAVKLLGIRPFAWDEVLSFWESTPVNPLINGIPRYAFTHSHKSFGV